MTGSVVLVTSDPVINSHREFPSKRIGKLPLEVLNLIAPALIPPHQVGNKILCGDVDTSDPIHRIVNMTTIHPMIIVEYIMFANFAVSPKL